MPAAAASIADSSGNIAASVLPPAVGASSSASCPSSDRDERVAPAAARSRGQPRVLTMWWASAGCSGEPGHGIDVPRAVQVDVTRSAVDDRRAALRSSSVSSAVDDGQR